MKKYFAEKDYITEKNSLLPQLDLNNMVECQDFIKKGLNLQNAWINPWGWQSWNPCEEIMPGKKQKSLTCHLIKQWNKYLTFPESSFTSSKNIVLGQFITYFRWENYYFFIVSTGNLNTETPLPPVQYVINRKNNSILIELADKGKTWKKDELMCQLEFFTAESYFETQEKLKAIFGTSDSESALYSHRFDSIQFLGKTSFGWESWYNHYARIDEKIILKDLSKLSSTENFLSVNKNEYHQVFQIDDGWEQSLGDWERDSIKFPQDFSHITSEIESKNLVPELWIAPFIIDSRSSTAKKHPEWLLKNHNHKLIPAGYNPLWGKNGTFYALDLSNPEVISHLDHLIETAINKWGFRYLKLDFCYAGMFYGNYQNKGAAYQWFNNAIKILTSRKTNHKGQPVAYLGCGVPFEPAYNYLPLSRIGCDTFEHWENKISRLINWNGRNSAYLNLKDTLGHAITDKIIFANDPDVIFIRENNCTLTIEEKLLIGKINIMFGSQLMYSDDPSAEPVEQELYLIRELKSFREKVKDEKFSVKNLGVDYYEIHSESGKYKGFIDLGKKHLLELYKTGE